ncbi:MAG TPA: grasp-with-spasm system ATP-grasp peptide maturase [Saprospiraceae bacterium]|nr:grasp-with-spasm system ATP-grasp peptide maturase [Saprospiraceae bacterium]
MIVIFSQKHNENSTNNVIDWLDYFGASYIRINGIDLINSFSVNNKLEINTSDLNYILKEGKVFWLRRWLSKECIDSLQFDEETYICGQANKYNKADIYTFTEFIFKSIPDFKKFNEFSTHEINKLYVLKKAVEFGIKIPNTFIVYDQTELENKSKNLALISKPLSNQVSVLFKKKYFAPYSVKLKKISTINETFFPSLVQEYIEKEFEIRTVYISGKFYSMAIFSQNNSKTQIDFRHYDTERPNRLNPYKLPKYFENKLKKIAQYFKLNVCSFDILKSKNGEYYFLEVNPSGQYGMTSYPCNYNLDKEIALSLINFSKYGR